MLARETFESHYRVLNYGDDGEYVLLYDTERDEKVWVNWNGHDESQQEIVDRLFPGFLIRATLVGKLVGAKAKGFEDVEILAETTLAITREVSTLPIDGVEDTWAAATGDGPVVTTVEDDDGQISYEVELLPDTYEGVDVFEAFQTGEWSLEPWYNALPVSDESAHHLIVANPQARPYTAIIGFPEEHPTHDDLWNQLIIEENQYQDASSPLSGEAGASQTRVEQASQSSATTERSVEQPKQAYTIEGVRVTPAPPASPVPYEYEDLQRGGGQTWTGRLLQALFWTPYLLLVFPLQCLLAGLAWRFFDPVQSFAGRLQLLAHDSVANLQKLAFFKHRDRAVLYLRASRVYTPAQVLPWVPGTAPISEDSSMERPPRPDSWGDLRRRIYRRDNHHCVNCGAAGGSHGNAVLQADHVLPVTRGGSDDPRNLRTLCRPCHQARHARIFN